MHISLEARWSFGVIDDTLRNITAVAQLERDVNEVGLTLRLGINGASRSHSIGTILQPIER
jgi:hypothetical protein